jgi:predicted transcriptional regulator
MAETENSDDTLLTLTADIVAAHVSNNSVAVNDLPNLIQNVHAALSGIAGSGQQAEAKPEPKVSIRSSIKPDYIVCLEDGKKLKMLKRHLMTRYQMTPADYRAKWKLPADYPMVAPNYAELRRALAHKIGLGRKPTVRAAKPAAKPQAETQAKLAAKAKIAPAKKPAAPRKKLSVATPT